MHPSSFVRPWTCLLKRHLLWSHQADSYKFHTYIYWASMKSYYCQTRVHLKQEHMWIFLDRELPTVQLSCLLCTVRWVGTSENGVRHTWMRDTLSLMNTRCVGTCQVVVVPESPSLACSNWWNNRNHFDDVYKEYLSGIHWHICFWK